MAISRFNDVRGKVEVIYSNNGSIFQAVANAFPDLLESSELVNYLKKRNKAGIHSCYTPTQDRNWEIMVK